MTSTDQAYPRSQLQLRRLVEGELRQLAELERDCCAFAQWSVHTRGEEVVLDVTETNG
jgi:hypothetical protein